MVVVWWCVVVCCVLCVVCCVLCVVFCVLCVVCCVVCGESCRGGVWCFVVVWLDVGRSCGVVWCVLMVCGWWWW